MREPSIDVFRGISINLMVFFTLILGLSDSLPDILAHNQPFSIHFGDFVLPMFLFASGMSIVFFRQKISGLKASSRAFFVAEKFGRLAVLWFWLGPFIAGGFFEMDELMLNAVLFIPAYLAAGLDDRLIIGIIVAVSLAYIALGAIEALPNFNEHYLGGFPAAPFYLPVMLGGVLAGKNIERTDSLLVLWGFATVLLLIAVPPYKMSATPSFMALSVFLSLAIFSLLRNFRKGTLEYLGRHPIRYWVLMLLLIVVPLKFYASATSTLLPLDLAWGSAVLAAIASIIILYLISKLIDLALGRLAAVARKSGQT